jgi:hypothetical protein
MKIDLNDFDVTKASEIGSEVTLLHPTKIDTPLDIKIQVAGPDSKRARDAERSIQDQIVKDAADGKLVANDDMFERLAAIRVASTTLGWTGIEWGGVPFPFSFDNAVKLYTERRWIRTQVENFMGRRENFFKPSV